MAEKLEVVQPKKIEPIRRGDFGQASHRFQQFDAIVPGRITDEDLQSPDLWVNHAPRMQPGDEIRARGDDDSFVALLHVTYSVGNKVRVKMIYRAELEKVDYAEMAQIEDDYEIKQRGQQKWCIIQKSTGGVIKKLIPTQLEAMQELDDLRKALAA